MENKVLIFRTDRIGDLLFTCPAIIKIKESLKKSSITLITSEKNYKYAVSLNIFDAVLQFPKKGLFKKMWFIFTLIKKNFDYIFVFDGKERSIISAILIKAKYKVAVVQKIKKYYKIFKIKYIEDKNNEDLFIKFKKALSFCQLNNEIKNFNVLKHKKKNNFHNKIPLNKYIHIHLDEKWIEGLYINEFTSINPSYDDFVYFLNKLSIKNNVLVTSGMVDFDLLDKLKLNFFNNISEKIYIKKNEKTSIYLVYKPSFEDIESLLSKTQILISCHGAITHAANSFNIKKIDIIEKNKLKFYKKFITYLESHNIIYRSEFNLLSKEIIKKLLKYN